MAQMALSLTTLSIKPGESDTLTVSVGNNGILTDQFRLSIDGLQQEWYNLAPDEITLYPGESGKISIMLHPPADAKSGTYPFSVTVRGSIDATSTYTINASLTIPAPIQIPTAAPVVVPPPAAPPPASMQVFPIVRPDHAPAQQPNPHAFTILPPPPKPAEYTPSAQEESPPPTGRVTPVVMPVVNVPPASNEQSTPPLPENVGQATAEILSVPPVIPQVPLEQPEPQPLPSVDPPQHQAPPAKMQASVQPNSVTLQLGQAAEVTVSVTNEGEVVDTYLLSLEGLEPSWYTLPSTGSNLFSGQVGTLPIQLHLPPAQIRSGDYPCSIIVQSSANRAVRRTLPFILTVAPVAGFEMEIAPQRVRTKKIARFDLEITNQGNTDINIHLEATDSEEAGIYRFAAQDVIVPAFGGRTVAMAAAIKPEARPQPGTTMTYNFTVTGTLPNPVTPLEKTAQGEIVYTQTIVRIPWGWLKLLVVVLVLLGIMVSARDWRPALLGYVLLQSPLPGAGANYKPCETLFLSEDDINRQVDAIIPIVWPTIRLSPVPADVHDSTAIAGVAMHNSINANQEHGYLAWDGQHLSYTPLERQGIFYLPMPPEDTVKGWDIRMNRDLNYVGCRLTQVQLDPAERRLVFISQKR